MLSGGTAHSAPSGTRTYRVATALGRGLLRALDVDLRVEGADNVPERGPVILASTHVSYVDMLPISLAARQRGRFPRFMARHDVWQPVLRHAMDAMGHIPVDRAAPAGAYLHARALLRAGETVAVFPEGGISYSFTVRALTRGVASLAQETGAVVVPVALWGNQRIYSVGRPEGGVLGGTEPGPDWTRGRRLDVLLGAPLTVTAQDDLTDWTEALGHRLTGMLEGLQRLPHHRPSGDEPAPWYPVHLGGDAPSREEAYGWDNQPRHVVTPTWGPTNCAPTNWGPTTRPPAAAAVDLADRAAPDRAERHDVQLVEPTGEPEPGSTGLPAH